MSAFESTALRRDVPAEGAVLLIAVWALALFALALSFGINMLSTDDAMRLVEVRDFNAGQGWFDLTQYRLDAPQGVAMHWSRLIDLPLAVMIRLGSLVVTQSTAEQITLALWPSMLLLAFLAGVVSLTRELSGETAARIALVFAVPSTFAPQSNVPMLGE